MRNTGQTIALYLFGIIILIALFLPTSWLLPIVPGRQYSMPFNLITAIVISIRLSLALFIGAVLLYRGFTLYQIREAAKARRVLGLRLNANLGAATAFTMSALLLAKTLHDYYWFLVWYSTFSEPLVGFWLLNTIFGTWVAGMFLYAVLPSKIKGAGSGYILLVTALLITASVLAGRVDYRQLTAERADHVGQALEIYYTRHGRYPKELQQLTPAFMLSLPDPIIIYGQTWCYDSGDDYYRLGYVYREHWSDRQLTGHIHKREGEVSEHLPLCTEEITALQQRYSFYRDTHWIDDES